MTQFAKTQKGTPYFMAPEVALEDRYTEKCDIYSLCATFYEIIKKKIPYDIPEVSNPIQLIMRKKDPENYEVIFENEFQIKEVIDIINFNLTAKAVNRMSAKDIKEKLEEIEVKGGLESEFWGESNVQLESDNLLKEDNDMIYGEDLILGKKSLVNSSVFSPENMGYNEERREDDIGMNNGGMMMSSLMVEEEKDFNPSKVLMGTIRLDDLKETESVLFFKNDEEENEGKVSVIDEVPDYEDYDDDFDDCDDCD